MGSVSVPAEQHILLHNVSWQGYENLLKEFDGRPIRLTYDQGDLEIMTLSHRHEYYGKLLGRLVETMTEELNIAIHSGGSTTFKREAKQRGLEADECYWVQNELRMRGKKEFDWDYDPPPDLALEIDITRGFLNRLDVYAALRIPEIWCFDSRQLRVYHLKDNGTYELSNRSSAFPFLPLAEIPRFLRKSDTTDETTLIRSFRAWIREKILPAYERTREEARNSNRTRRRNGKRQGNQR
jgi:Uma2 family endonuclease